MTHAQEKNVPAKGPRTMTDEMVTATWAAAMRLDSGEVDSDDSIVAFLYLLGRDHLPLGMIEEIMDQAMKVDGGNPAQFCNGWLAEWAQNAARRLEQ